MTRLAHKTVLLTGSTGGFGQAFGRQLLERGGRLILTDLHAKPLRRQADELRRKWGERAVLKTIVSDLSQPDGVEMVFEQVQSLRAPVDILINNAGLGLLGRHDEVPVDAWERLMAVNLLAPMRLCAHFVPLMVGQGGGHLVNICSVAAWTSDLGLSAYAASKFGLRGFSEALHDELKRENVRVSAVHPFYSRTPILDSPRYGVLAASAPAMGQAVPGVTDPAAVVAAALDGIEQDRLHIFPDSTGRWIYRLSRYAPRLFKLIKARVGRTT